MAESTRMGSARLRTPTPRSPSSWMRFRVSRTVRPKAVQGVHDDHVAVAGVGQGRLQSGATSVLCGLAVDVDPLGRDTGGLQGLKLTLKVLLRRRDAA